jgi:hypothetical protein
MTYWEVNKLEGMSVWEHLPFWGDTKDDHHLQMRYATGAV